MKRESGQQQGDTSRDLIKWSFAETKGGAKEENCDDDQGDGRKSEAAVAIIICLDIKEYIEVDRSPTTYSGGGGGFFFVVSSKVTKDI